MLNKLLYSSSNLHATNLDEKHGSYDYQKEIWNKKGALRQSKGIICRGISSCLNPKGKSLTFSFVV